MYEGRDSDLPSETELIHLPAKDTWGYQKMEKARKDSPLQDGPAHNYPLELQDKKISLVLRQSVYGTCYKGKLIQWLYTYYTFVHFTW